MKRHSQKITANKRLGQHFLTDTGMITRIVDSLNLDNNLSLLEIGPGLGALTLPVLQRTQQLTAVELDKRVIPVIKAQAAPLGHLTLIEQDALNVDYPSLLGQQHWHVFGNLPYNISTPLLFTLAAIPQIKQMTFMLQKEVVDRLVAQPGEKNYGRLSIMLQYHHDLYPLFDVPPTSFDPPPKVMSAMIGAVRLPQPRWPAKDPQQLAQVVKQAFSMRRKTLKNNLKPLIDSKNLTALGIDPGLRAEVIDGYTFTQISNFLSDK